MSYTTEVSETLLKRVQDIVKTKDKLPIKSVSVERALGVDTVSVQFELPGHATLSITLRETAKD